MAPTLNREIGLRQDTGREVTPPAVQPEGLASPLSAALPRTVAGRQRTLPGIAAWPQAASRRTLRVDWPGLGVVGLMAVSAVVSVYRLFWATQF